MKYTTEEALSKILQRKAAIDSRKREQKCNLFAGLTVVMSIALIVVIALMSDGEEMIGEGSVYGAFLLSKEAAGYVAVAVLAFILGVMVTLLCLNYRRRDSKHNKEQNKEVPESVNETKV